MDAWGVAAMLAADAELDARARPATALGGDFDELADTLDVEADEGIGDEDALVDILGQETARIVAADADRRLGQVVGAEAEEFGRPRELARHQRGARPFDHRSEQIGQERTSDGRGKSGYERCK